MERQPKAAVSFNDFEEGYIDDDEDEDGDEEGVFTPTRKGKRASFSNYLVKGSALDFLEESKQVVKSYGKKFAGETLAFITPWNNKGYDVAKAHAGKFDYISPVWYQLRRDEETQQIILTGGHDADRGWLGGGGGVAVVPRALWEVDRLRTREELALAVELLAREARDLGYEGYTLELPYDRSTVGVAGALHGAWAQVLGAAAPPPKLILVVQPPPARVQGEAAQLDKSVIRELSPYIHRFMIMTYDHAMKQAQMGGGALPGPNAPAAWVEAIVGPLANDPGVEDGKLMLGVPFYGWEHAAGQPPRPVLQRDFEVLARTTQMEANWMAPAREHVFIFRDPSGQGDRVMSYPTMLFLQERVKIAQAFGVGIGIWELGQGFDRFVEVL